LTKISRDMEREFSRVVELEEQKRFKEATQRLRSLIDAGATTAAAYAKLGGLLCELDQLDAAEGAFREAVAKAPRWVAASLGLFHTLWQKDLPVEALEEAKRFTKLTGSDEYMAIVREINERSCETLAEDEQEPGAH
jgi:tetratricopeptide (TPR) repeat protein